MSHQITSAIIGLVIAGTILWLIRRDHLHSRHALWWLMVTFIIIILGIFPHLIEIARQFGVNYPPTLVFILAFGMILVKVLSIDLHQSKLERQMRRLIQRIAILETEKRQQKNAFEQEITHLNQKIELFETKELTVEKEK